jgi:hypothetical protein
MRVVSKSKGTKHVLPEVHRIGWGKAETIDRRNKIIGKKRKRSSGNKA